jgi:tellurite resistance protein
MLVVNHLWHLDDNSASSSRDTPGILVAGRWRPLHCVYFVAGQRLASLAQGLFTVGAYFGVTFGSLIVGRLMTEQRLSDAHFPALAVLMVPPATASTAWFALNGNGITTFGIGLAAVLAMMALMQLSTSVIRLVGIA